MPFNYPTINKTTRKETMKKLLAIGLVAMLVLSSCIGTDIVEELQVPEEVTISEAVDSLRIGDSFQFAASHFDDFGQKTEQTISWSSTDETIISINNSGLATALTEGNIYIRAWVGETVDSVKVNSGMTTSIMSDTRSGMLQGRASYTVVGDFNLRDTGDNLELTFESNFRASNGPGLFVYLSNAGTNVTGGVELGRLMSNSGSQTYVVSKNDAQLNTYSHVVIYCKPFGVSFGFGAFNN